MTLDILFPLLGSGLGDNPEIVHCVFSTHVGIKPITRLGSLCLSEDHSS